MSARSRIPELLTLSRLAAVPLMLLTALLSARSLCIALATWAVVSDAIDGRLARALGVASERGARLDSLADCALYLTAPWLLLILFPWVRASEAPWMVVVFVAYAAPIAYGFARFGRLTSYHTTAARAAGVMLVVAIAILLFSRVAWPLHVAVVALVLSALEEIAITNTLPAWRAEVPSLRRLRALARPQH